MRHLSASPLSDVAAGFNHRNLETRHVVAEKRVRIPPMRGWSRDFSLGTSYLKLQTQLWLKPDDAGSRLTLGRSVLSLGKVPEPGDETAAVNMVSKRTTRF